MSERTAEQASVNPLLQIDTCFQTYLNAYTRSYQKHIVDGALDYAFESDFAVRQKIIGLSGWSKLFKVINSMDISAEAKHLFLKCDQVGPLKYPEIYDVVKKCSERLELNIPIVFIREDLDRPVIYSIASNIIEPCIVLSKSLAEMYSRDEIMLLIGCECGKIQNNHCAYNMAFTYLNYNQYSYKPTVRNYQQTVSNQLLTALVQWVKYADITAYRAGIICLDQPGKFINILSGIYNKGYIDFYGRQQTFVDFTKLSAKSAENHSIVSRDLTFDSTLSDIERGILAANEFLNCQTLYSWRADLPKIEQHTELGQICDVRTSVILGNGGQQ